MSRAGVPLAFLLLGGLAGCGTGGGAPSTAPVPDAAPPLACGTVTTLASADVASGPAVLQGDAVLWGVPGSGGSIRRVPLDGEASTVLAPGTLTVDSITADATRVYWSDAEAGGLMMTDLGGGPVTLLVALTPPQVMPQIAVDADSVYWFAITQGIDEETTTLTTAPLTGGQSTDLASLPVIPQPGSYFAVDDTSVYWGDPVAGTIMSAPKTGGPATTLTEGQAQLTGIAIDADNVYWASTGYPTTSWTSAPAWVAKVPKTGGPAVVLASVAVEDHVTLTGWGQITVDATGVYWFASLDDAEGTTELRHTSLDGGPVETLARHGGAVWESLITCPGGVCWTAAETGEAPLTLMRWQGCP